MYLQVVCESYSFMFGSSTCLPFENSVKCVLDGGNVKPISLLYSSNLPKISWSSEILLAGPKTAKYQQPVSSSLEADQIK